MHDPDGGTSAWHVIAEHDEAAALVAALLDLDPDTAGVALKSLYLNGTLQAVVDLGLVEKRERDGEEALYSVAADSDRFEAARAFERAGGVSRADSA